MRSTCPRQHFEENFFGESRIIFIVCRLWGRRSVSVLENFDKIVKTAFYLSRGTFSGFVWKNYLFITFSVFPQEIIQFFAETIRQVFQTCSMFVRGNILVKDKLFEKKIQSLPDRSRTSSHFSSTMMARMIQQACPNCILRVQWKI